MAGVGVSYGAVRAWEKGTYAPTGARLRGLAAVLGVSMEEFFEPPAAAKEETGDQATLPLPGFDGNSAPVSPVV